MPRVTPFRVGAIQSLTGRSVQLMKRIKGEPEYTLVGGILRWGRMARVIRETLKDTVNVPEGDLPQYTAALGCAVLGHLRSSGQEEGAVTGESSAA